MTPLDTIENGIKTGDLGAIATAFRALTGRVVVPAPPQTPAHLVAILEWYADKANYTLDNTQGIPVLFDEGARAREVLGERLPKIESPQSEDRPTKPTPKKRAKKQTKAEPVPVAREPVGTFPIEAPQADPFVSRNNNRNWQPPKTNKFRDTKTEAKEDIKTTHWINANVQLTPRRPPARVREVTVECDACGRNYRCLSTEVRIKSKNSTEEDLGAENICPRCITGSSR